MRTCLKCAGAGETTAITSRTMTHCWMCNGVGSVPPITKAELAELIYRQGSFTLRANGPLLAHKAALGLVGKTIAWKKVAKDLEEVHALWVATPVARRARYAHAVIRHSEAKVHPDKGLQPISAVTLQSVVADAYRPELDHIIREMISERKGR